MLFSFFADEQGPFAQFGKPTGGVLGKLRFGSVHKVRVIKGGDRHTTFFPLQQDGDIGMGNFIMVQGEYVGSGVRRSAGAEFPTRFCHFFLVLHQRCQLGAQ